MSYGTSFDSSDLKNIYLFDVLELFDTFLFI